MGKNTMKSKQMVTMVDPDGGWKYGFPKVLPDELKDTDITSWLIDQGFPEFWVNHWNKKLGYVPCRFYDQEIVDCT
jgi:hypothetical protein